MRKVKRDKRCRVGRRVPVEDLRPPPPARRVKAMVEKGGMRCRSRRMFGGPRK